MAGRTPNWEETRVDIGALAQRVTGLEQGLHDIRGAIGDLSKKLDARPTNWIGIISALVAVLVVIGGAVTFVITPINSGLDRHEHEIAHIAESSLTRDDYFRNHETLVQQVKDLNAALVNQVKDLNSALGQQVREQDARTEKWNSSLRDRQRFDEDNTVSVREMGLFDKKLDERQEGNKIWFERLMNRIDAIDNQLVKRPELQAASDNVTARINTLGNGLHELQAQVQSFSPPNQAFEHIEHEISELRQRGLPAPVGAAR